MHENAPSDSMTAVDSAAVYVREAHVLDPEQFATRFGRWFLVHVPGEMDSTWDEDIQYQTMYAELPRPGEGHIRSAQTLVHAWRVAPLKKRDGNPFPDRISVGRAKNCDVVLRVPFVSKLHAHFLIGEKLLGGERLQLVDQRSANGTSINGNPVRPGKPARISSADTIGFGRFEVTLFSAADLRTALVDAGRQGRQLA